MPGVLVIEDEPEIGDFLQEALESASSRVELAATGAVGMKMLVRESWDLVVIDVILPDASGIALAEIATSQNIPVIMITGDLASIDGLAEFGYHCLEKPFRLAELDAEVAQVMNNRAACVQRVRSTLAKLRATIDHLTENADDIDLMPLVEVGGGLINQALAAGCRG